MKKPKNIEFESLLKDEEFIRLVNDNPLQAAGLIDELCREEPDNAESIRLAAAIVHRYTGEQLDLDEDKISMMWNNILLKSELGKPAKVIPLAPFRRIAVAVAILISLSICLLEYSQKNEIRKLAEKEVGTGNESRIILSDGSEHRLNTNETHIQYDALGKEIVIEDKTDQMRILNNQAAEEKSMFNQVIVPYGRRHRVTLSDGTVVKLNSGSKLVFPAKFSDAKREVFLIGEGYFDVAKDASRPFIVNTEFINVKVLGTHFNISAYENEKSATAVLVEGSVEVYRGNLFSRDDCLIKPGQGCFFNQSSDRLIVQDIDVDEYVSWKDGYFQLKNQSLETITKKLEKYYDRSIVIEDRELAHRIISGKLVLCDQLEETTAFLAKTTRSRCFRKDDGTNLFVK